MSHSWLQRKRKSELLELAQRANIADADSLLKDDLVAALEETLEANESTYAKQSAFSEFYGRSGSPVKRERSSPAEPLTVTKPRRRQTISKNADPDASPPGTSSLVTRTPRAVSRIASRLTEADIPASPAQLADYADQGLQVAKSKATELWQKSKIDEAKEFLRENFSSVSAIQVLILLIEAGGLQYNTLTTDYAFDVPAVAQLGTKSHGVHLPNVWTLLTSNWWAPTTLWAVTSWVLPFIASYFFNLTLRSNTHHKSLRSQYTVDPLTFNVVKAFLAYCVFQVPTTADPALAGTPDAFAGQTPGWGPFSESTIGIVRNGIPGHYAGMQIGAFIGVLISLYDAALKK